jgi:hypothetical protein
MDKIRSKMEKRNALCQLTGSAEFDEAYFSKATPEKTKLKRRKGCQKKDKVAVMVE